METSCLLTLQSLRCDSMWNSRNLSAFWKIRACWHHLQCWTSTFHL